MRKILIVAALPLALGVGGCVRTVAGVVKAPFQAAGQVVDWTTTSQDEADRNYGRKTRKKEAREGRERRDYEKRCRKQPETCRGYDGYQAAVDE
jgi:hypothetical protein